MATYVKRDQGRSAGGTRDRRKMFEDVGGGGGGGGSTYSSGATSRYNRDRTDSPSSRGTSSITSKMNNLNVNDDEMESKEEESTTASARTTTKKYGGASIANKINKLSVNDDEGDDDSDGKEAEGEVPKQSQKNLKKAGANANSGRKRKEKKNLRQKRRSTGVVIMPGQPVNPNDDEEKAVQENTARNMDEAGSVAASGSSGDQIDSATSKQNEQYIEELKDELAKAHRELETLRNANLRLKDENSALLRVVGSLTGTGR